MSTAPASETPPPRHLARADASDGKPVTAPPARRPRMTRWLTLLFALAGDLADDAHRGRVVGTVVSGVLIGILASRTISGLVADAAGWRAIYTVAAVAAVLFAGLLYPAIPPLEPKTRIAYPALIASV